MPLYEYQCENCGKTFEIIQKFSDPPLSNCPHSCGKEGTVKRLVSRTSFQLKGGGWYATDYKKSPSSPAPLSSTTPVPAPSEPKKAETCASSDCGKKS
jgi:putative FmdB family regulatory protein